MKFIGERGRAMNERGRKRVREKKRVGGGGGYTTS